MKSSQRLTTPDHIIINTPQGIIRRNRCAIIATPLTKDQVPACRPSTVPPAKMTIPNRPPVENNLSPPSTVQQTRREDPGQSTSRTRLHSTAYPANPVQRDTVRQTRQEDPGPSTPGPSSHSTVPLQTLTNPVQRDSAISSTPTVQKQFSRYGRRIVKPTKLNL